MGEAGKRDNHGQGRVVIDGQYAGEMLVLVSGRSGNRNIPHRELPQLRLRMSSRCT